jgi:hypothetical protein
MVRLNLTLAAASSNSGLRVRGRESRGDTARSFSSARYVLGLTEMQLHALIEEGDFVEVKRK